MHFSATAPVPPCARASRCLLHISRVRPSITGCQPEWLAGCCWVLQSSEDELEEEDEEDEDEDGEGQLEEEEAPRYSRRVRNTVQHYSPPNDPAPTAARGSGGGGSGRRRRSYQQDPDEEDSEEVRFACELARLLCILFGSRPESGPDRSILWQVLTARPMRLNPFRIESWCCRRMARRRRMRTQTALPSATLCGRGARSAAGRQLAGAVHSSWLVGSCHWLQWQLWCHP